MMIIYCSNGFHHPHVLHIHFPTPYFPMTAFFISCHSDRLIFISMFILKHISPSSNSDQAAQMDDGRWSCNFWQKSNQICIYRLPHCCRKAHKLSPCFSMLIAGAMKMYRMVHLAQNICSWSILYHGTEMHIYTKAIIRHSCLTWVAFFSIYSPIASLGLNNSRTTTQWPHFWIQARNFDLIIIKNNNTFLLVPYI